MSRKEDNLSSREEGSKGERGSGEGGEIFWSDGGNSFLSRAPKFSSIDSKSRDFPLKSRKPSFLGSIVAADSTFRAREDVAEVKVDCMVESAMLVLVPEGFMEMASGSSTVMKKGSEGKMEEKERVEGRGRVKSTSVLRWRKEEEEEEEEEAEEVEKRSKASPGGVDIDLRLMLSMVEEGVAESEEESEEGSSPSPPATLKNTSRSFIISCIMQLRFGLPFPTNLTVLISLKKETFVSVSVNPLSRISPSPFVNVPCGERRGKRAVGGRFAFIVLAGMLSLPYFCPPLPPPA